MTTNFGEFIRERRLGQDLSLRAFCDRFGEDPSNWSKMERGLLLPPASRERLSQIAGQLSITTEEDLQRFSDLADLARQRIPDDIAANEEWMAKLPVVFRTVRGEVPTEESLLELANLLKEELTAKHEPAR